MTKSFETMKPFEIDRQKTIIEILRKKQNATVKMLVSQLYVSEATVRRDLNALEACGLIKRMHGGAVLLSNTDYETPILVREQQNVEAKHIIAAKAANFLQNGSVIFLDASSTTMALIKYFSTFEMLTIITNGIKNAQQLSEMNHNVYCTGGRMLHSSLAYVGNYTEEFVRRFNADLFFFSAAGVSEEGMINDVSSEETSVRRAMLEQSRKRIFMCDQSKIGKRFCYNLCPVSQVDAWITDADD